MELIEVESHQRDHISPSAHVQSMDMWHERQASCLVAMCYPYWWRREDDKLSLAWSVKAKVNIFFVQDLAHAGEIQNLYTDLATVKCAG